MDERRASNEPHLEQTVHKMFDDYIEARVGELITTNVQLAMLNNELLHHRGFEPTVETAVNRRLHVALECPTVADTLPSVIAELVRTDDGVESFSSIKTTKPNPALLRTDLLTPEKLRSMAAHLFTVPQVKEAIVSAVLPHDHKAVTDTSAFLPKRHPSPGQWTLRHSAPK